MPQLLTVLEFSSKDLLVGQGSENNAGGHDVSRHKFTQLWLSCYSLLQDPATADHKFTPSHSTNSHRRIPLENTQNMQLARRHITGACTSLRPTTQQQISSGCHLVRQRRALRSQICHSSAGDGSASTCVLPCIVSSHKMPRLTACPPRHRPRGVPGHVWALERRASRRV